MVNINFPPQYWLMNSEKKTNVCRFYNKIYEIYLSHKKNVATLNYKFVKVME